MTAKFLPLLLSSLPLVLGACRENPELVRKREEQRAEIKRLEGEIALIDEKLKAIPVIHEDDLAKARKELESQNTKPPALSRKSRISKAANANSKKSSPTTR